MHHNKAQALKAMTKKRNNKARTVGRELIIPPAAQADANGVEVIRAWVAKDGLHCSLRCGVSPADPTAEQVSWGVLLSDIARHVADALQQASDRDSEETLRIIGDVFHREMVRPTTATTRGFFEPNTPEGGGR